MMGRRTSWPTVLILLATLVLAVVAVRWADREFERIEPPGETASTVLRPAWVRALDRPYRRVENAWIWVCVVATVGMGASVALDGRWRRPFPPGTLPVLVALLVGAVTATHFLLATPAIFGANGTCYGLRNVLEARVPGAIMGSWVVTWGRKTDWRGRLVSGLWMVNVGFLVAYAILFG